MMKEGVLSDGSAFFITGNGSALSLSWMKDGRPCNLSQERAYYPEGWKIPVTSKNIQSDVSGCIFRVATVDSNRDK